MYYLFPLLSSCFFAFFLCFVFFCLSSFLVYVFSSSVFFFAFFFIFLLCGYVRKGWMGFLLLFFILS